MGAKYFHFPWFFRACPMLLQLFNWIKPNGHRGNADLLTCMTPLVFTASQDKNRVRVKSLYTPFAITACEPRNCVRPVVKVSAEMCENESLCDFYFSFFSHQGHLRWLPPWFWFFLRLHRFVEQSVPHPRRLVQRQPADETLQKVKPHQQPQVAFWNLLWCVMRSSVDSCKTGGVFVWMLNLYDIKTYVVTDEHRGLSWLFLTFYRSTEEVIALFISIAFVGDAVKGTVKSKTERILCLSVAAGKWHIHAFVCHEY